MGALKAPFPAFGGKGRVASLVWERLGDVDNFIEPFANSAAVLLARPTPPKIETINDFDCMVANFWRATANDPEAVASFADWPINEADLHARHRWLVLSDDAAEFRRKMRTDPEFYDAKVAGWWVWGACCWIGSGWCKTPESAEWAQSPILGNKGLGQGINVAIPAGPAEWSQRPYLSTGSSPAMGIHVGPPDTHRPQLADAYARGRGVHGNDSAGTCAARREWLVDWFNRLRDRLRTVRVCCGDWKRVCNSHSVTTRLGVTGIFLDAPYKHTLADGTANRSADLYANDKAQDVNKLVDDVIAYCVDRGGDPDLRIAACCYEGEGYEVLAEYGWECVPWKAGGGYGNRSERGKENAARERIWFSPACVRPLSRRGDLPGQLVMFSAQPEPIES